MRKPRVRVVLAQLLHVLAQQHEPDVADQIVEVVAREGGAVATQRLDDAADDQPLVALHEVGPQPVVLHLLLGGEQRLEQRRLFRRIPPRAVGYSLRHSLCPS